MENVSDIGIEKTIQEYMDYCAKNSYHSPQINIVDKSKIGEFLEYPQELSGDSPIDELGGESMYLVIACDKLKDGNEIGVRVNNNLVGSTMVSNGVAVLTIWGNEINLNENKNANGGDLYDIYYFDKNLNIEQKLTNLKYEKGSDVFDGNTYVVINDFDINLCVELGQNHPNPIYSHTMTDFKITYDDNVKVELYDSNGKYVKTLINKPYTNGNHSETIDLSDISVGNYHYLMLTNNQKLVRNLIKI